MVKNLNTLISSASSALSVTWDQQEPVPGTPVDEPSFKQVRDYFGNSMFEEVAARNPVAVTLAFEMHLVQFVEQVTSGWGGGAAGGVLGEIYGMISTAGEPGRMRAIDYRLISCLRRESGDGIKMESAYKTLHATSRIASEGRGDY